MRLPASNQNRRPSGLHPASLGRRFLPNRREKLPHLQRLGLEEEFLVCHLLQREAELLDDLDHGQRLAAHPAALLPRSAEPHRLRNLPWRRPRFLQSGRRNRQERLRPSACPAAAHQAQARAKEKPRLYQGPLAGLRLAAGRPRPRPLPPGPALGVLDLAWRPAEGGPGGPPPSDSKAMAAPSPPPSPSP